MYFDYKYRNSLIPPQYSLSKLNIMSVSRYSPSSISSFSVTASILRSGITFGCHVSLIWDVCTAAFFVFHLTWHFQNTIFILKKCDLKYSKPLGGFWLFRVCCRSTVWALRLLLLVGSVREELAKPGSPLSHRVSITTSHSFLKEHY